MAKNYANVRSDENLGRINSDLYEIKGILDKNLTLLLNRETKLGEISDQASALKLSSEKMLKSAEQTKLKLRMRKYLFLVFVALLLVLILAWKLLF